MKIIISELENINRLENIPHYEVFIFPCSSPKNVYMKLDTIITADGRRIRSVNLNSGETYLHETNKEVVELDAELIVRRKTCI